MSKTFDENLIKFENHIIDNYKSWSKEQKDVYRDYYHMASLNQIARSEKEKPLFNFKSLWPEWWVPPPKPIKYPKSKPPKVEEPPSPPKKKRKFAEFDVTQLIDRSKPPTKILYNPFLNKKK